MADADDGAGVEKNGLMAIELDESLSAACGEERRKDLRQAVDDLLEENSFALEGKQAENGSGPFILRLALIENRLIFSVLDQHGRGIAAHILSLSPLRRAIQDYNLICGSYSESVHSLPAERLEAIDMTRRALHDEGARMLAARLRGKIRLDHHTARGLFTIVAIFLKRG